MLVLLLSYSKSLFVGVTWASLIVFFYLSRRIFVRKKIKENILDSVGLFSYLWQKFMEIVTEMGQKFEGIGEGVYLVIPVCLLIKKKIKGSKEYSPQ